MQTSSQRKFNPLRISGIELAILNNGANWKKKLDQKFKSINNITRVPFNVYCFKVDNCSHLNHTFMAQNYATLYNVMRTFQERNLLAPIAVTEAPKILKTKVWRDGSGLWAQSQQSKGPGQKPISGPQTKPAK